MTDQPNQAIDVKDIALILGMRDLEIVRLERLLREAEEKLRALLHEATIDRSAGTVPAYAPGRAGSTVPSG